MNDNNNNNYYDNHGDDYNHAYDGDTYQEQKKYKKHEYVKCVSSQNKRNVSWCGVRSIDWMFQNVDHALNLGKQDSLFANNAQRKSING